MLQLQFDSMVQFSRLPHLLRADRRRWLAIHSKGLQPFVLKRWDFIWDAMCGFDAVVFEGVGCAGRSRLVQDYSVERVHGDIGIEVVQRREEETRRCHVGTRVRRVFSLGLVAD